MALRLTPRSPRGPALLPPFGDNACALRRHQHRDARTTRLDRAHRIVRRRGTNPRCNPMRPPHPAPDVRDDREAPLKRGGTEGMIHDFWKKERRILRNRSAGMMGLKRQEKAGYGRIDLQSRDGPMSELCQRRASSLACIDLPDERSHKESHKTASFRPRVGTLTQRPLIGERCRSSAGETTTAAACGSRRSLGRRGNMGRHPLPRSASVKPSPRKHQRCAGAVRPGVAAGLCATH
jgi:hypothetical protein